MVSDEMRLGAAALTERRMRFPLGSHPIVKTALFAILNVATVVFLLLRPASPPAAQGVLLGAALLFFILWNALLYRQFDTVNQNGRKTAETIRQNEEYKRQVDELRARQHDLKNQLAVIREMLENHGAVPADISTLAEQTAGNIDEISMMLKLDNAAVNAVIYNKYLLARDKGIELAVKSYISGIRCPSPRLYDLTSILGNIIDNAIESSGAGDKVSVEIGERNDFLYFSIINSGTLPCNDVETLFSEGYSSKGTGRGFGLSNVRRAVRNSGGNIELTAEDGRIECRVYFPISA